MRAAIVCEINLQRTARGLPGLDESGALDTSAQGWSEVMVATHQLSHGASFTARISAAGYRNVLSPAFRDVGIGEVPAAATAAGPATWTADFGVRLLASPASTNAGPANGCPY